MQVFQQENLLPNTDAAVVVPLYHMSSASSSATGAGARLLASIVSGWIIVRVAWRSISGVSSTKVSAVAVAFGTTAAGHWCTDQTAAPHALHRPTTRLCSRKSVKSVQLTGRAVYARSAS